MKICYISDLYYPYALGGAETYLLGLVNNISKFTEVSVITTVPRNSGLCDQIKKNNVQYYRFQYKPFFSIIDYNKKPFIYRYLWQAANLWNPYTYQKVRDYLKIEKPDIVHTHNFKGLSPSIFSAIADQKLVHVHTVHDYNLISPWSNLRRQEKLLTNLNLLDLSYVAYMKHMTRSIKTVVFPSKFCSKLHRQFGFFEKTRTEVINNGISFKLSEQAILKESKKTTDILFVGILAIYKGVNILIKAFQKCLDPNLILHIVGDGPDVQLLKDLAKSDDRIVFHGRISVVSLELLFNESDFFVLPSVWYEVLPVVIQEAMAHGLPVVGSAIGGILDLVIDDYNGYTFPPGDIYRLKAIIEKLAGDSRNLARLRLNCISFVKKFDMSLHASTLIDLYKNIAK